MSKRMFRTAWAAVGAIALVAAGCGNDADDSDDGDATVEDAAVDEAADGQAEEAAGDEVVTVHGVDFAFQGLPDSVGAGTRLTLVNDSDGELHELVAFRIPDDEERSVEELLALPEEEQDALAEGPPAMVLIAPPGEEGEAVVGDGTLTEPGRYVVLCAIPTGADPAEFLAAAEEGGEGPPEVEGGEPHFVHGMFAELTVE